MTDNDKITLIDENNNEVEFTVVDYLEIDDNRYVVLLPDEDPEEGAIILRVEQDDDGEDILVEIEDDDEFDRVVEILESEMD
ncbi:MAG: DUF1292 domain-containing protein [Candidatus Wallacebacter cryptica]|jgi:uncharacterized protein YrzB (UPF0473 family)|nr:DUF1292 domain-containing protein [Bacillota bacterium]